MQLYLSFIKKLYPERIWGSHHATEIMSFEKMYLVYRLCLINYNVNNTLIC